MGVYLFPLYFVIKFFTYNKDTLSEGIKIHPPETASLLLSGDLTFLGGLWEFGGEVNRGYRKMKKVETVDYWGKILTT